MASYEVSGMQRVAAKPWGPVTVICNSLSTKAEYCKLTLQIQYVAYMDILTNMPAPSSTEATLLSLRFQNVELAVSPLALPHA